MPTWAIIIVTFVAAFWLGYLYKGTYHRRRGKFLLKTFVTVVALVFSALALVGILAFISPTLAFGLGSKLPPDIQNVLFFDFILRGGTGVWIFTIIAAALWWARTRVR